MSKILVFYGSYRSDRMGKPHVREYFIVATSKDDIKLQQYAQAETQRLNAAGRKILIEIWGWDTLKERIDQSESAKEAFDPGFSPSIASKNKKLDALLSGQKKQASKAQVDALAKSLRLHGPDQTVKLPPAFADRELRYELSKVLRRRGFAQSNPADELAALADRAIAGDLSQGSAIIRAEVCDRAARELVQAKWIDNVYSASGQASLFEQCKKMRLRSKGASFVWIFSADGVRVVRVPARGAQPNFVRLYNQSKLTPGGLVAASLRCDEGDRLIGRDLDRPLTDAMNHMVSRLGAKRWISLTVKPE